MTKIAIAQLFIWMNFQLVLDIFIGSDGKDSSTVIEKNNLLQRHLSSIIKYCEYHDIKQFHSDINYKSLGGSKT